MEKGFVVAIDGPAGAGKSTIAKLAAGKLGFAYIDTGAMYRAVTWKLLQTGEAFSPELAGKLANEICITFRPENAVNRVFVDGTEVTDAIRTAEVTGLVSKVAAVPEVRTAMVDQQRRMGEEGGIVMDGRDIGTYVLPNAEVKIYQIASVEVRAKRRYIENQEKGIETSMDDVIADVKKRDYIDSHRAFAPLRPAEDAVHLDTDNLTIDEVVEAVLKIIEEKTGVKACH
jgi:cytidylate kinase